MHAMTYVDVLKWVGTVLFSVGGGGLIVLALSSWLGKVWANRLMEQDRAKYATGLEGLKAKYEEGHRRLQAELDKTIFGHQLKTQTEFNALMELWKRSTSGKCAAMDSSHGDSCSRHTLKTLIASTDLTSL
jgi:hypothetical protein